MSQYCSKYPECKCACDGECLGYKQNASLREEANINVPDVPWMKQKSSEHICNKIGCINIATNEIVWHLAANAVDPPIISTPIARLCNDHSHGNLWREFWSRESWKILCDTITGMGRRKPIERYSNVHTQPIGTSKKQLPDIQNKSGFTLN